MTRLNERERRWHVRLWDERTFTLLAATWEAAWMAARRLAAAEATALMAVTEAVTA